MRPHSRRWRTTRSRAPMWSAASWSRSRRPRREPIPLFTLAEARALGRPPRPSFSACSTARARFAVALDRVHRRGAQGAGRLRRHRSALDRGPRSGRGRPSAAARRRQGAAQLACAASLLLRIAGPPPISSKAAGGAIARPAGAAFPAHRSGRDHAAGRGRALRARPVASFPARHVVVPGRFH